MRLISFPVKEKIKSGVLEQELFISFIIICVNKTLYDSILNGHKRDLSVCVLIIRIHTSLVIKVDIPLY